MRKNRNNSVKTHVYVLLLGKPQGKRPPEIPRRRWEESIKGILEKLDGVVWTGFICLRIGTCEGIL
jgi:hypothetical protein